MFDRRERQVGQRRRWPLTPGASPPPGTEGMGEQPLEDRVECSVTASGSDGLTELVKYLVLANDDGISPDCDGDGVTDDSLIDVELASFGDRAGVGGLLFVDDGVCLDPVAGLEDEAGVMGGPFAGANAEALALHGRHMTGMRHECDEAPWLGGHYRARAVVGSMSAGIARVSRPRP